MTKEMPEFRSDKEEREFWKTHDIREYIDWGRTDKSIDRFFEKSENAEGFIKELEKGLSSKKK